MATIDVWFARTRSIVPHALDDDERARAGRFACADTAATYRAAHTLARRVLSHGRADVAPSAWRFETNAWGKPRVATPRPAAAFNLSHSGDCIAMAVAPARAGMAIGVDIERLRPMPHRDDVAGFVFHPDELRWLDRQPHALRAFFRLWTLKEALLKAAGTGFSHPPRAIAWQALDAPWARASFGGRTWRGATRTIDGEAIVSVAVPLEHEALPLRLLTPGATVTAELDLPGTSGEPYIQAIAPREQGKD